MAFILRRALKTAAACTLQWTGIDKRIGKLNGYSNLPFIAGYHQVVEHMDRNPSAAISPMLITTRTFERQLDWIGRRFEFISLDDIGPRLESGGTWAKRAAVITFDDGYSDVYHHAFPILKKKGIPAAIFVVSDWVGTRRIQIHDRIYLLLRTFFAEGKQAAQLASILCTLGFSRSKTDIVANTKDNAFSVMRELIDHLSQKELLRVIEALEGSLGTDDTQQQATYSVTWTMLEEMCSAGMTIGSHTKTHALLTNESPATVAEETAGSQRDLEKRLGIDIRHFAYPDGRYDPSTVRAVASSGYRLAFGTCRHRDNSYPLLTIPRIVFRENSCLDVFGRFSSAMMSCQVNGVFDLMKGCAHDHKPALS